MTPTPPPFHRAALYSLTIALPPWVGGMFLVFRPTSFGDLDAYVSEPGFVVFPVIAFMVTLTLRLMWPMPTRLRTASVDTTAYAVTLWLVHVVGFSAGGDVGAAVNAGFVLLILAAFTLQYPLCFALSLALSKRVLGQDMPILIEPSRQGG